MVLSDAASKSETFVWIFNGFKVRNLVSGMDWPIQFTYPLSLLLHM